MKARCREPFSMALFKSFSRFISMVSGVIGVGIALVVVKVAVDVAAVVVVFGDVTMIVVVVDVVTIVVIEDVVDNVSVVVVVLVGLLDNTFNNPSPTSFRPPSSATCSGP